MNNYVLWFSSRPIDLAAHYREKQDPQAARWPRGYWGSTWERALTICGSSEQGFCSPLEECSLADTGILAVRSGDSKAQQIKPKALQGMSSVY